MPIHDKILHRFLQNSFLETKELEKNSDVFSIISWNDDPPSQFFLAFKDINYLSKNVQKNEVRLTKSPVFVNVFFPPDYLRSMDPNLNLKIVRILNADFFHPNIKQPLGFICLGHNFLHGSSMCDIIFHIYDIVTYQNITVEERDALNPEACRYCRANPGILQKLHNQPLRRRKLKLNIKVENIG